MKEESLKVEMRDTAGLIQRHGVVVQVNQGDVEKAKGLLRATCYGI